MNSPGPGPMALWIRGSHYPGTLDGCDLRSIYWRVWWLNSRAQSTYQHPLFVVQCTSDLDWMWWLFSLLGQIHSLRLCGLTRTVSHWIQICEIHSLLALIEIFSDCWFQTFGFFSIIYGMSSQPHWRTPSFFQMVKLHHQPVFDSKWSAERTRLRTVPKRYRYR